MTSFAKSDDAELSGKRFSVTAAGIATLVITLLVNVIIGVVLFFGLIVLMNGFSGKDAEIGILLFIFMTGISGLATAILSFFACGFVKAKWKMNGVLAALGSILLFGIINGVISFFAVAVAIGIAESFRKGGN